LQVLCYLSTMKTKVWVTRTVGALLIIGASVALFFAQSSYWVNHTVFNQQNFSAVATEAIVQPSSRDAIATTVVNRALEDRPVAQRVIGDRAEKLVSSLLGSDFSSQAVSRVVSATYKYITTPDRQDVVIELQGIKAPVSQIITLAQAEDSNLAVTVDSIPDEIKLVESDEFPDLSGIVTTMLWVGPLLWLLSIGLFTLYIYLHRKNYALAVYTVGVSIGVVALLGILTRPIVPPPVASLIPQSDLRPVVQNISDAFLAPFQMQMVWMLVAVIVALAIFSLRKIIARQFQKVAVMISPKNSEEVKNKPTAKKK